jgi:two-component system CheB/CheR fusion protein
MNEQLHSINEELRERSADLSRANSLFESILAGMHSGVVVLDRAMRVVAWNYRSEDLWGLGSDDVMGQNFLSLDIGLPVDRMRAPIEACIAGDAPLSEVVLDATKRRGGRAGVQGHHLTAHRGNDADTRSDRTDGGTERRIGVSAL